ncbi:MAG: hypothetical protein RBS77_04730 [Candidatus Moranbacteria bacterium]|jgi:tetratricopeptide (TPR) repeat protein|nr:hypothetical protein [Candidatus Moranbacteria bacterium]
MQSKKIIAIVFLFIAGFVLAYFFVVKKMGQDSSDTSSDEVGQEEVYSGPECFYADIVEKISADHNADDCKCIKDKESKSLCVDMANDLDLLDKSASDLNIDNCDKIKNNETKVSCRDMVKSGLEIKEREVSNIHGIEMKTRSEYEKIRNQNPNDVGNLISLALSYLRESAGETVEQVDTDKINGALLIIKEAKKIEPDNSRVYSAEGYIYVVSLQNDKAIVAFSKSLELDSNNNEALIKRATVYSLLGKSNEAIADLEKAAALDKDKINAEIYMSLCELYAKNSDKQKAAENCNIIINSNDNQILKNEAKKTLESII